jgi:2-polyprenyl-3-methyl-5-hydroxy-6-metoxy-1,4-benzoquinol methylase
MQSSSSWHKLNADRRVAHWLWPFWFFLNQINNRQPNKCGALRIEEFTPENVDTDWIGSEFTASPSRRLTDLFLASLPWQKIEEELGGIHILDLGCGPGKYARFFDQVCSERKDFSYLGIDQRESPRWQDLNIARSRFEKAKVTRLEETVFDNVNVITSITMLEHLDEDLTLFRKIEESEKRLGRRFLQIHVIPSAVCLWLYGLHGVRQYTPRTIEKIEKILSKDKSLVLYRLGGRRCNWIHFKNITFPIKTRLGDRRFKDTEKYRQELHRAIEADNGDRTSPSFYALVIAPKILGEIKLKADL